MNKLEPGEDRLLAPRREKVPGRSNGGVFLRLKTIRPRIGIVCDYVEENWPSMDLVADMLLEQLLARSMEIEADCIRPRMARHFTALRRSDSGHRFNADRLLNRFWEYPKFLRQFRRSFDIFHIIDHSYAQLVLELPADRTVITCHDTDTFRCLVEPRHERRSFLFRAMMRRTLAGFQKAAVVVCPSKATHDALVMHELIPKERLRVVPLGVDPTCSPAPDIAADRQVARWLGPAGGTGLDVLHVGSTIPRKRIDVLLRAFAEVKRKLPDARLIRVGGAFTKDQETLLDRLHLRSSVLVLPHVDRTVLAAIYRRATVLVLTPEREGFGLPVLEAMACGVPVVSSDLAALRETGGQAAWYCPVGDASEFASALSRLLEERRIDPVRWHARQMEIMAHAEKFTWRQHARQMIQIYREVLHMA